MKRGSSKVIIDVHAHLLTNPVDYQEVEQLLETGANLGVTKFCVSSLGPGSYYPTVLNHEPTHEECVSYNKEMARLSREYPGQIYAYCYLNASYKEAVEEAQRCIEDCGMIGIKLWTGIVCSDKRINPLAEKAIALGVPILQHTWDKVTGYFPNESRSTDIAALAARYPELKIIMAHNERGARIIAKYPNVYIDTASPIPNYGLIENAVDLLGPDRIVFGSDTVGVDLAGTLGKIIGADLKPEVREKILCGNAQRLFGGKLA